MVVVPVNGFSDAHKSHTVPGWTGAPSCKVFGEPHPAVVCPRASGDGKAIGSSGIISCTLKEIPGAWLGSVNVSHATAVKLSFGQAFFRILSTDTPHTHILTAHKTKSHLERGLSYHYLQETQEKQSRNDHTGPFRPQDGSNVDL